MSKFQKSYENITIILQDSTKIPILLWISLVYIAALLLQSFDHLSIINNIIFTCAMIGHCLAYWHSKTWSRIYPWLYVISQGFLIFLSAFWIPAGSPAILIGLLPIIIAQSITVFESKLKIFIFFIIFYGLFCIEIVLSYGSEELPIFIPILFIILTIVVFYTVIYNRQVNARLRMEYYLKELETAHKEVEKLTLANERQRMARDLHDTLAQGIAGFIMQLEAIQVYIDNGNKEKSQEIVLKSMQQARETLKEARIVIDNLRYNSNTSQGDFNSIVLGKIQKYKEAASAEITYTIDRFPPLSTFILEHSVHIVSECLTNVIKHSQATQVKIHINKVEKQMVIKVEDNGVGFAANMVGKHTGKYGLLGITERVRLLGGKMDVKSIKGKGTTILVEVPI